MGLCNKLLGTRIPRVPELKQLLSELKKEHDEKEERKSIFPMFPLDAKDQMKAGVTRKTVTLRYLLRCPGKWLTLKGHLCHQSAAYGGCTLGTNLCSDFKVAPAVTAPRASQGTSSLGGASHIPCLLKSIWLFGKSITLYCPVNSTSQGQVN